jgi:hypothetical protein
MNRPTGWSGSPHALRAARRLGRTRKRAHQPAQYPDHPGARHDLTPDGRAGTAHGKRAPFDYLPVGSAGSALLTMRPGREPAPWPPAYRGASRCAVPLHPRPAPSVTPFTADENERVSAGGAALRNFLRTRSVDQVGRKSETTLRIASLHFEFSTLSGAASDQLKLPSGAPDAGHRQWG